MPTHSPSPLFRILGPLLLILTLTVPCHAEEIPRSGSLSPEQGMALLDRYSDRGLILLDVRTRREFDAGHAPGALHIPIDELARRADEIPSGPVLIICRSGRRAAVASDILKNKGRPAEMLWYLSGYTDYSSGTPRFHD